MKTTTETKDRKAYIEQISMKLTVQILKNLINLQKNLNNKDNLSEVLSNFEGQADRAIINREIKDQKLKETYYDLQRQFMNYKKALEQTLAWPDFMKYKQGEQKIIEYLLNQQKNMTLERIDARYSICMVKLKSMGLLHDDVIKEWRKQKKNIEEEQKERIKKKDKVEIPVKILEKTKNVFEAKPQIYTQNKQKIDLLHSYLLTRKQKALNSVESNEVARFLRRKLDSFMRVMLQQVIGSASIRNKKLANCGWIGNEFRHYSKQNPQIKVINPLTECYHGRIIKVSYPSKLQLYSELRVKEERQQTSLIKEIQSKRENDKKTDKKIWDYLLQNREAQKSELWTETEQKEDDRLCIEIKDVRYILQIHPWLSRNHILFSSYHI